MENLNPIRDFIAHNKIKEAIDELKKVIVDRQLLDSILIRSANLNNLERGLINGTLTHEESSVSNNELIEALLRIINLVEEDARQFKLRPISSFDIKVDPDVVAHIMNGISTHWKQRCLYLGVDGGKGWLQLVEENEYQSSASVTEIRELILKTLNVKKTGIKTFVSFGPGDGEIDRQIIAEIESPMTYIPIDISDGLLYKSIMGLRRRCNIPIAILSDFEESFSFIKARLKEHVEHPLLACLTGNTLGNVDKYEKHLLTELKNFLQKGDFLLIQVSIYGEKWQFKKDFWASTHNHTQTMKRFFAHGIERKGKMNIEDFLLNYDQVLKIKEGGSSDVKGTKSIDFSVAVSNGADKILSIRRYDWKEFTNWIRTNFPEFEIEKENMFLDKNQTTGSGCIVLRKQ